jgi:hypothetical protein
MPGKVTIDVNDTLYIFSHCCPVKREDKFLEGLCEAGFVAIEGGVDLNVNG